MTGQRGFSVAMSGRVATDLMTHLLRPDGQEDVCLVAYRPSTGTDRTTMLIHEVILPQPGERSVHGNASFTGDYIVRSASQAASNGSGIALVHSHPGGRGWQQMSTYDADAERSYAYLVHEMTGLPFAGMTLAGSDLTWSARRWSANGSVTWCENVRVVDSAMSTSWNDNLRPPPELQGTQIRTASGWGERTQAGIARLRVLVVGAGSVGLEVALRLAATGLAHIGVMDFDTVELANLDRLIGATELDVHLHRAKTDIARRLLHDAATAAHTTIAIHDWSICEPEGHAIALDYDIIFSCVDRPWPRAVLNMLAYTDLIPVIDGGIHIDPFPDDGMRNATWRSHVIRPGRPCMSCSKQLDLGAVALDRDGLLDDPEYIAGAGRVPGSRQNVAALSVSVVGSLLAQFVSLVAAPGGEGEPGPLQYTLSTHTLEHLPYESSPNCFVENAAAAGDGRLSLTGTHRIARQTRLQRAATQRVFKIRIARAADDSLHALRRLLSRRVVNRPTATSRKEDAR